MPSKKIDGITRNDFFYVETKFVRVEPGFNGRITTTDNGVAPDDDLADLESIREHGVLVPLMVRPDPEGITKYVVIEGHRRLAKVLLLNANGCDIRVPVIVEHVNEQDAAAMMAMAGLQRKNFSFAEEVNIVRKFARWGLSPAETAKKIGMPVEWVRQHLAVSAAPESVLAAVASGAMPADVAVKIANLSARDVKKVVDAAQKGRGCARKASEKVTGKAARPGKKVVVSMKTLLAETKRNRSPRVNRWIETCLDFAAGMVPADDLADMLRR
jgi:ParB/RepB/Spo0J family partition protein